MYLLPSFGFDQLQNTLIPPLSPSAEGWALSRYHIKILFCTQLMGAQWELTTAKV